MGRRFEIARNVAVARIASFRADKLRARDAGRRKNRAIRRGRAGKQNDRECDCPP